MRRPTRAVLEAALALALAGCSDEAPDVDPSGAEDPGKGDLWHTNQAGLRLPFLPGRETSVSQGYHGNQSHLGYSAYAVDFPADVGTTVTAVRAGIVIATKADSDSGCGNASCAELANYAVVDHGDGTLARYYHLERGGVDVEVGSQVCPGDAIARTGNTGFSTGPHLHFEIINQHGETLPLLFDELAGLQATDVPLSGNRIFGAPFPGARAASRNEPRACWRNVQPSACDDSFIHFGVRVLGDTPCTYAPRDTPLPLEAIVFGDGGSLLVGQKDPARDWTYQCLALTPGPRDLQWRVSTTLTWPRDQFPGPTAYLMLLAGDGQCGGHGWDASTTVYLAP